MRTVDPDSDEVRQRREALGRRGGGEAAAARTFAPYAVAALLLAVGLVALALLRPEWATSYAALTAALVALPFLHTVLIGIATGGAAVPRPFGLRPIPTVLAATALFGMAAIAAPDAVARFGGAAFGMVVALIVLAVLFRLGVNALH